MREARGWLRAAGAAAFAVGAVFVGAGPVEAAVLTASGLEANANAAPLGIDDATPTLSWRLSSDTRAIAQTKYRVVVATTAAKAAAGQGDVWDSGDVTSDRNTAVYAGPALASRTRYYWSVKSSSGALASDWAPAGWFETAYLSPAQWQGTWIAGPSRLAVVPTTAQGTADDDCCVQGASTLAAPAAAGDSVLRLVSTANFFAGKTVTVDGETKTISAVGTGAASTTSVGPAAAGDTVLHVASVTNFVPGAPITVGGQTVSTMAVGTAAGAATTLFAPVAVGDTNLKVSSTAGYVAGQAALIENEVRTVSAVGTQGRATTLSAAAAATDTNVKVASVTGLVAGDPITIGTVTKTVTAVGTAGATGTGLTLAEALGSAVANGAAVRYNGTGITLSDPITTAHALNAATRGLGSGIVIARGSDRGRRQRRGDHDARLRPHLECPAGRCPRERRRRRRAGSGRRLPPGRRLPERGHLQARPPGRDAAQGLHRRQRPRCRHERPPLQLGPRLERDDDQRRQDRKEWPPEPRLYRVQRHRPVPDRRRHEPDQAGWNVIASELGAGRYDSESRPSNHHFEDAQWRAEETLRADLYIKYADGFEQLVKSDETWKTSIDGPTRYADFDTGETFDARKQIPGWDTTATNDASWASARAISGPAGKLIAQKNELTENVEDIKGPFTRWTISPGVYGFDVGKQTTGWATVKIWGATAGQVIRVVNVERRNDDATLPGTQDGALQLPGNLQQEYYVSDGTGTEAKPEVFTPKYNFSGFQWVQIDGSGGAALPANVNVDVDSVQVVHTALRPTGVFDSSNQLLEHDQSRRGRLGDRRSHGRLHDGHADLREGRLDRRHAARRPDRVAALRHAAPVPEVRDRHRRLTDQEERVPGHGRPGRLPDPGLDRLRLLLAGPARHRGQPVGVRERLARHGRHRRPVGERLQERQRWRVADLGRDHPGAAVGGLQPLRRHAADPHHLRRDEDLPRRHDRRSGARRRTTRRRAAAPRTSTRSPPSSVTGASRPERAATRRPAPTSTPPR